MTTPTTSEKSMPVTDSEPSFPWLRTIPETAPAASSPPGQGLRFAFYGRVSTEDHQDPEASRLWQYGRAEALIKPAGGSIVTEYFDIGQTRALPWKRRTHARELLAALADRSRGFDAVVIGEPQRAFYGSQFGDTFPLFVHYGVPLWVPEVGGAIDPDNEAHDLIMSVFGGMSKGERNRIKLRVHAAMSSQTVMEGRYLGGRPPYGYRLRDLGPHPKPGKAAEGKLSTDSKPTPKPRPSSCASSRSTCGAVASSPSPKGSPATAPPAPPRMTRHPTPTVIPEPGQRVLSARSSPIPATQGVRSGTGSTSTRLLDIDDVSLGYTTALRWNSRDKWIVSEKVVHTPLVDDETFARFRTSSPRAPAPLNSTGSNAPVTPTSYVAPLRAASATGRWSATGPTSRRTTGAATRATTPSPTGSSTRATSTYKKAG